MSVFPTSTSWFISRCTLALAPPSGGNASGREDFRWLVCFAIIAPILMSGVIEILQSQTTYRSGDWADLLANSIGVFAAIPLGHFLLKPIFENHSDEQTGDGEEEV